MTALVALTQADTVVLWHPTNRTLIVASLVGKCWRSCPGRPRSGGSNSASTPPEAVPYARGFTRPRAACSGRSGVPPVIR